MKSKNRKSNGRNKTLGMESLEDRHLLATVASTVSFLSDSDLSPNVEKAFERAEDLSQYTAQELRTSDWVVRLNEGHSVSQIVSPLRVANSQVEATPHIDRTYIIPSIGSSNIVSFLSNSGAVERFYPLVAETNQVRLVPNDPLFGTQWHLNNVGQSPATTPGEDVNILNAWDVYTGDDVVIGIVDDGVDSRHPDLNYRADLSFDFVNNDGDANPLPADSHGTAVAGLAAAIGNNDIGVVGTAFEAEVASIRLLNGGISLNTDQTVANALSHAQNEIDIYNASWGPADIGEFGGGGPLALAAIETNAATGSIYVWAAGNGRQFNDNSNYDSYTNSPSTIAVTAVNGNGDQGTSSEPGANILVAAPANAAGVVTTDNVGNDGATIGFEGDENAIPDNDASNYTANFGDTSAAAPIASGIIALMLDANPNLNYRDVEHILVETSRMNDATDADWTVNGAGHDINHKYGFGVIDAEAATNAAVAWNSVSALQRFNVEAEGVNQDIPDADIVGTQFTINVPAENDDVSLEQFSIEHVQLTLETSHQRSRDLDIRLTSPDGTESVLAESSRSVNSATFELNWVFDSVRHWGEGVVGDWILTVADRTPGVTGQIEAAQLTFSGTSPNAVDTGLPIIITPPSDNGVLSGTVFDDDNGNGVNDDGELGLQGQTVFLDANTNGILDEAETTTVTNVDGQYFFTGLPIGTYTVGYVCNAETGPGVVLSTASTQTAIIGLGGNSPGNDFASSEACLTGAQVQDVTEVETVIEGVVYFDADRDGVQDPGENGIPGMTVYADLNNNCVIGLGEVAGYTDANGHYTVAVTEGTYFMRMVPRPGLELNACQGTTVTAPGNVITNHNIGYAGENQYDYGMNGTSQHGIYPGLKLGNLLLADTDSLGTNTVVNGTNADGTVLNETDLDDNDGVIFTTGLTPGQTEQVIIVTDKLAVSTAYLQGWVDWNGDGDFGDTGEQIFRDVLLREGINSFDLAVPANAATGVGIDALFRYGFELGLGPFQPALGGEAEHYVLNLPMNGDTGITAVDDVATVAAGAMVTISPLANDSVGPLGGGLTITNVSSTDATIVDNTIVYTPAAGATSPQTFTYTIQDTLGGTATANVTVNIMFDFPVATADTANVLLGSDSNVIEVLSNDMDRPEATTPSTITAIQSTTDQGGTALIAPDGMSIFYTPPTDFEGTDTFSYTITDANDDTDTATVTVTVAPSGPLVEITLVATDLDGNPIVDPITTGQQFQLQGFVEDIRDVPQGVFSAYLDVALSNPGLVTIGDITYGETYMNNLSGMASAGIIDEVGAQGGPGEPSETDPIGAGQFHLFTVAMTAVSEGTLDFTSNPADILPSNETTLFGLNSPVPNSLITFIDDSIDIERAAKVEYIFEVVDTNGAPISNIAVGQDFVLNISVQDLTNRPESDGGVFSAYVDASYDQSLVDVGAFSEFTFADEYMTATFGDPLSMPGLIDELGATSTGLTALGNNQFLVVSVPFTATAAGMVNFTGTTAGVSAPPRETTLFGENVFIPEEDIRFTPAMLTIGNATAALSSSYSNARNSHDVNGDGQVSPIDALSVINYLNFHGSQALPTTSSSVQTQRNGVVPTTMVDVNNDGFASPMDALMVINWLNGLTNDPQAAASSVAFVEEENDTPSNNDQVLAVWSSLELETDDDADEEWVIEVAGTTFDG